MSKPSVSIVIVSFNSEETLGAALDSIPGGLDVVVVEQSATGTAEAVATSVRPGTRVIRSGANRGFGAGCNLGAANVTGDVIVFLNPDACLEAGTFEDLAVAVRESSGAIVGPALRDEDGRDVSRARAWTTPSRMAVHVLLPSQFQPARWRLDVHPGDVRYREGGSFDVVQGACFAVGRDTFFAAGGFNEAFFLFGEEEFLARSLLRQGLRSHFLPSVVVRHVGHTSTDTVASFATQQLFRSTVLNFRLHQGMLVAVRGALLLWAVLVFLMVATPIRRAIGYRPDYGVTWCADAVRGTWAGLFGKYVDPPPAKVASGSPQWR